MKKLLESAAKLVFILMAAASVAALFLGRISGEQWLLLASSAFTFFYTYKGNPEQPFAGK